MGEQTGADVDRREPLEPQARGIQTRKRPHLRVSLLDGFKLEHDGLAIVLPERSQCLLAFAVVATGDTAAVTEVIRTAATAVDRLAAAKGR
jgi:hypothetical protein